MAIFIELKFSHPNDAEYINLDNVNAFGKGVNGGTKLYMSDGKIYEASCVPEEFVQILQSRGLLDAE